MNPKLVAFCRTTGQDVIVERPGSAFYNSPTEWVAEFNMETTPPTLVNDGGCLFEFRQVVDKAQNPQLPPIVPRLYIDAKGNIRETVTNNVIFEGPSK